MKQAIFNILVAATLIGYGLAGAEVYQQVQQLHKYGNLIELRIEKEIGKIEAELRKWDEIKKKYLSTQARCLLRI